MDRSKCFAGFAAWTVWISFFVLISRCSDAFQVIGANETVVQGRSVILPCKLIEKTEELTQISWQRKTRGHPQNDNFLTIQPKSTPVFVNQDDGRFKFIGEFNERNGSLKLSNVTLSDEGVYTCIFTLFPSGNFKAEIHLNLQVPPVIYVEDIYQNASDKEVTLARCTAAGSRPPAEVKWVTDTKLKDVLNITQHDNGTTTTVSSLVGKPSREINELEAQCKITSPAQLEQKTIGIQIQIHFPPTEVNIRKQSEDSFECTSEANPKAELTWSRPGQSLPVKPEGTTLRLSSDLDGLYQCEATNQYGKARGFLYVAHVTGSCTACWIIISILIIFILGVVAWHCYKTGYVSRIIEVTREMQPVSANSNSPAANEPEREAMNE